MTAICRRAPAKLNLTLEVLGRRADGYHELRSVLTTIDLCDTLEVDAGRGVVVSADETYDALALPSKPGEVNTVETALALVAARRREMETGERPSLGDALREGLTWLNLQLRKEIPTAAGLGGGSSDGATALLVLNQYWGLGLTEADLLGLASEIGSDCPFFLDGGVQLAAGRGELLRPLPPPAPFWLCLLEPPVARRNKTARLYSLLRESNFSDGVRSTRLAQRLMEQPGTRIGADDLCNCFDAVADAAFGALDLYRNALEECGAGAIHLCGAGPTLYGLFSDECAARSAETILRAEQFKARAVHAPAWL